MIEQIYNCQKCGLCLNQKPLLDTEKKYGIFWVGLSAKKIEDDNEIPLSPRTNSGRLIEEIEKECKGISTYKTNLVKCLPLTEQKKLRYPNQKEIDTCFEHLEDEIQELSPKIVFLLGEKVYLAVEKHLKIELKKWNDFQFYFKEYNGVYYVPIHHPSYIYVYKRKQIDEYIKGIKNVINKLL
ncbi:uracil-DNA glycosylase family protein [Lachnospiraceae bacterium SGI.066]